VFTARYALSPYIKQIRFVFKGLKREAVHFYLNNAVKPVKLLLKGNISVDKGAEIVEPTLTYLHFSVTRQGTGTAHLVQRPGRSLDEPELGSRQGQDIFIFSKTSRPNQWVPVVFPWGKAAGT
jgi:hypothetical protein